MTLRPGLVLIALPPPAHVRRHGSLILPVTVDLDRMGLVVQVADDVREVKLHDRVVFDTYAAEEVTVDDWPCVVVPETAIEAVVEL